MQINVGFNLLDSAINPDSAAGNNLLMGLAAMGGNAAFRMLRMLSSKFRKACNSFDGETLISTETGLRPIDAIEIGDKVWAYNEETEEKSLQAVVHLIRGEGTKELVVLQLVSGETITATSGHPFYLPNQDKWVEAGKLTINDVLQNLQSGLIGITSLRERSELATVYNLTVANDHTYYVGHGEVLVHNEGGCPAEYIVDVSTTLQAVKASKGGLRGGHHAPDLWGGSVSDRIDSFYGFYTGVLTYGGRTERKRKTFFPDSYSQAQVMMLIRATAIIGLNGKSGKTKIDLGSLDPKIPKGKILIDVFVDKQGSIHHATPIIIGR
jgi:hypothetical protein